MKRFVGPGLSYLCYAHLIKMTSCNNIFGVGPSDFSTSGAPLVISLNLEIDSTSPLLYCYLLFCPGHLPFSLWFSLLRMLALSAMYVYIYIYIYTWASWVKVVWGFSKVGTHAFFSLSRFLAHATNQWLRGSCSSSSSSLVCSKRS